MKNPALTFISASLLFFSQASFAYEASYGGSKRDTNECLEISGSVEAESDSSDFTLVELITDNVMVQSLEVHSFQPFKFELFRDKQYTIKLSKKGFIGKSISISTDLPKTLRIKANYKFHFETDLTKIPDNKVDKMDALDYPIALVRFDETKKKFEYSEKYSTMINALIDKDLYKVYGGDGDAPPPPPKDKKEKEKKKK